MTNKKNDDANLAIFEDRNIRRVYDKKTDTWFFSVVDVVGALTDSANPRDYWFKMKIRVKDEDEIELSTNCRQLKLKAPDGKMRSRDKELSKGWGQFVPTLVINTKGGKQRV